MISGLFTLEKPGQPSIRVITELRTQKLQDQTLITNGEDLMWFMLYAFEKEAFLQGQVKGVPLQNSTRVTFRWEGETAASSMDAFTSFLGGYRRSAFGRPDWDLG